MKKSLNLFQERKFNVIILAVIVGAMALTGIYIVFKSHAAATDADINGDHVVDVRDLAILAADFRKTGQTFAQGDLSGGGIVDLTDYSILAVNWGLTSGGGTTTRGWAKVLNGTLVSDQNTLLRGGTLWFIPEAAGQYRWATSTSPWPIFTTYHMNTVRLAMEYRSTSPNSLATNVSLLDTAIAQAAANHMYAVIDLHGFAGGHEQSSAVQFWQTVAPRYKNNTNVIFELLNEPVAWNPKDYTAQDIADEDQLYGIVHAAAPQTPVIMMSFAIPANTLMTNAEPTMTTVSRELTGIDWNNTAVGFHGYWIPNSAGEVQLKQNFPAFDTEFQTPCTQANLPEDVCQDGESYEQQTMERLGISWLCWDCNDTSSSSNLAGLETHAKANNYWWNADQ